ncbi:Maf-like protein [Prevotella sp. OH937_COT-195]|uniref:Maf-like protein n=1 Tax=Prevotella sp. OH937_COT-195 TaxID=2491051 RepID=UPI000F647967|nr:Maf-like protein [Prevotella sp. OH937_COT-195]RRD00896.1 septum formation protein Maf [Prevotella sp. OH937_COT-195]
MKIILASGSPRRKELLSGLNVDFEIRLLPGIDESYPDDLPVQEISEFIARKKSSAYKGSISCDELVITADTIVVIDGKVLGKPVDAEEACSMLRLISGRTHQVITGVCLMTKEQERVFSVETDVTFKKLSESEIEYYVEHYKPFDKAGAYGIQEWIGFIGVESIQGSYFNVMGLPVQRIYSELLAFQNSM